MEAYFGLLTTFRDNVSVSRYPMGDSVPKERDLGQSMAVVWARLHASKVFALPADAFVKMYHEIDVWTEEEILKQEWIPPLPASERAPPDPNKISENIDRVVAEGSTVSYPEKLPFDHTLLLFLDAETSKPAPIRLSEGGAWLRIMQLGPDIIPDVRAVNLHGILLSSTGDAFELLTADIAVGSQKNRLHVQQIVSWQAEDGKWVSPYTLNPWLFNGLVDLIESYKSMVVKGPIGLAERREAQRARKSLKLKGLTPPPYYVLHLQDEVKPEVVVREKRLNPHTAEISGRVRYVNYRSDVRAHDRLYVRRGVKPMLEEERAWFAKRNSSAEKSDKPLWVVYEEEQPPEDVQDLLAKRGHHFQRRANEWLAIKIVRVDAFVKGPEEAPYVPAIRHMGPKQDGFER